MSDTPRTPGPHDVPAHLTRLLAVTPPKSTQLPHRRAVSGPYHPEEGHAPVAHVRTRRHRGRCAAARRENPYTSLRDLPRLLRHPVWGAGREERGHELGILLVPGFCAGSSSLALTRRWLQPRGFDPRQADVGFDIGCTGELVDRLEEQLADHVRDTGGRVLLLGHSRGGGLARPAAARRPDLVRDLITLGLHHDGWIGSSGVPARR
jgi:pimeloyl-ACP methyl ester carboxylesterase